jgi:hypothetical protein
MSISDYDNAFIYKIVLNGIRDEDFYIGSTIYFNQRLSLHKNNSISRNSKLYKSIRENGGNFIMCKLYDFPCKNELELRIGERKAYDLYKPSLNTIRPYITDDERKENHTETSKNYYENNKEKVSERKKKHYQINKDKNKEKSKNYYENNKDILKDYYENNKDKFKEKNKNYYEKRKNKLNEKIKCECGCMVNRQNLKQHQTSKKHIKLMR